MRCGPSWILAWHFLRPDCGQHFIKASKKSRVVDNVASLMTSQPFGHVLVAIHSLSFGDSLMARCRQPPLECRRKLARRYLLSASMALERNGHALERYIR